MISFKQFLLQEKETGADLKFYVFRIFAPSYVFLPLSVPMLQRVFGEKRFRGFHITKPENAKRLAKIENKAKAISTLSKLAPKTLGNGVASGGGMVAEVIGSVAVAPAFDVFSTTDRGSGRRWVKIEQFFKGVSYDDGKEEAKIVYDYLMGRIAEFLEENKIHYRRKEPDKNFYETNPKLESVRARWMDMYDDSDSGELTNIKLAGYSLHIGDENNAVPLEGKVLNQIHRKGIKFYFDIWEEYLMQNKAKFEALLYAGLKKSKSAKGGEVHDDHKSSMSWGSWDEIILSNFTVAKIFLRDDEVEEHKEKVQAAFPNAEFEVWSDNEKLAAHINKKAGVLNKWISKIKKFLNIREEISINK